MVSISLVGAHVLQVQATLEQTIPWARLMIGLIAVRMTEVLTLF
jgi:hypothetical protein